MTSLACLVPGCDSPATTGVVLGEAPCVRICELRTLALCSVHAGVVRFGLVGEILTTVGFEIVDRFSLIQEAPSGTAWTETA